MSELEEIARSFVSLERIWKRTVVEEDGGKKRVVECLLEDEELVVEDDEVRYVVLVVGEHRIWFSYWLDARPWPA